MAEKKKPPPKTYRVVGPAGEPANWGVNYHPKGDRQRPERRAEVGAVVSDLPMQFRDELLAAGLIEEVSHA